MASPIPNLLPNPTQRYSYKTAKGVQSRVMDSGRLLQWKRSTLIPRIVRVQWQFTDSQLEVFKAWHNLQLLNGSLKFTIDLAFGNSMVTNTAQFVSDYEVSHKNHFEWLVDAELEVTTPS